MESPQHVVIKLAGGKRQYRKGRHYRSIHSLSQTTEEQTEQQWDMDMEEEDHQNVLLQDEEALADDETQEALLEQERIKEEHDESDGTKKFVCRVLVAPRAVGTIIGRKGATLKSLEKQTDTTIRIDSNRASTPGKKSSNEPDYVTHPREVKDAIVIIKGKQAQQVASARTRIFLKEQAVIDKLPYTHFISVPLALKNPSEIKDKMAMFKEEVLTLQESLDTSLQIEESLFTQVNQLHCTLLMLKIYSNKCLQLSVKALRNAHHAFTPTREELQQKYGEDYKRVKIAGLEYMNDDPENVHVLYGQLHGPGEELLKALSTCLVNEFLRNNLTSDEELHKQRLTQPDGTLAPKLHITLLNSRRRSGDTKERQSFNAIPLLQRWGSHVDEEYSLKEIWETKFDSVHLSSRGIFDEDQYFYAEFTVSI